MTQTIREVNTTAQQALIIRQDEIRVPIKIEQENIDLNLPNFELGGGFLHMPPKVQAAKEKNRKSGWTPEKLKTFVLQKTPSKSRKDSP